MGRLLVCTLLVGVAALACLGWCGVEAQYEDELLDKPAINYDKLFRAYIQLGEGLFGTWIPVGYEEEMQRKRDELV